MAPYSYQVLRAPDAGNTPGTFAPLGTSTTALTYTDTGLPSGTQYWYEVAATDSETPSAVTATSTPQYNVTNFVSTATFNPGIPIQNLPTTAGDVVTVPLGAFSPGSNPITAVSLYAGTTPGGEASTAVATITSPTFPVTFGPQPRPAAGQSVYYVVKTSDGHVSSPPSNELRSATTAIAPSGTTAAQVFTAPYGPTESGQTIGYTVYDPTGAVIEPHTATGVSEIPGTGIYSASVPLDAADYGTLVWDAPGGATPIVQSFTAAGAGLSGRVAGPSASDIAAAVAGLILANPSAPLANDAGGRLLLQPAQPGVTIPAVGSVASLPEALSASEQNSLQAAAVQATQANAQATQANAQATQANAGLAGIPAAVLARSIGHGMTVGQLLVLLQATDAASITNTWNPYTHILTTSYQFAGDPAPTRTDTTPFPATQATNPGVVGRSTATGAIAQP